MSERASVKAPKRTRNDGRKLITRQRLIDATIDIVRTEGAGALTTGRIANTAGIQQPGFYAHFKNVDECLKAAAAQVTATMMDAELRMRRQTGLSLDQSETIAKTVERVTWALGLWLENRRFAELVLRCRFDDSPIGESAREAMRRGRATLTEDLLELAVSLGISTRYLREIEVISMLITAAFMSAVELILNGTAPDVRATATALARSHLHHVRGEFRRMLREQEAEGRVASRPPSAKQA